MVLIVQGSSARLTPETEKLPVDATIIGIVDTVNVENKTIFSARDSEGLSDCQPLRERCNGKGNHHASHRRTDPQRRAGSAGAHAQRPAPPADGNGQAGAAGASSTTSTSAVAAADRGPARVRGARPGRPPQGRRLHPPICIDQAEALGREELEETKIGRLEHKIEKLKVVADRIPGVEFLRTEAFSGENGITLQEYAPFGVIGVITPVTHSLPTLAGNAINMLAAGNALVCNPHPGGARIACKGAQLFNQAIHEAIGIDNLITIIDKPTLESAQAIFDHRDVRLLCVTGGPAVGRAALRSPKRAIVAGPGNPPVVVDETADLDNAARSIIAGGAYDNNLLCIGEKEVFAVAGIFDELLEAMTRHKAVRLDAKQIEALTKAAFVPAEGDKDKLVVNKDLIGQDAAVLAEAGRRQGAGRHRAALRRDRRGASVRRSRADDAVRAVRARAGRGHGHRPGEEVRARLQAHGHHPFAQRRDDHAHGPGDGHDAVSCRTARAWPAWAAAARAT